MRQLRHLEHRLRALGPLALAVLSVLTLCLTVAVGDTGSATAASGPGGHPVHVTKTSSGRNAIEATTLAANAAGGLPAGGVPGDVTDNGVSDILAIDTAGNLWLYPNTTPPGGSGDQSMFDGGRSQVGQGWNGYTLAVVGWLYPTGSTGAGIVAIDPAGNMWVYPNTGGTGLGTFGAPTQIGIGWNGYTVAGIANLNSAPGLGIVAIDPAGNLWYYPGTGGTGMSTFGPPILVGTGWTGYTADVTNVSPPGLNSTVIVAVDSNGNLWLYPNTGGTGTSTFGAPIQVGSGWQGWQAVDVGSLQAGDAADIFGIDASGNLWFYANANTGASDWASWDTPIQVGIGWTGYRIN